MVGMMILYRDDDNDDDDDDDDGDDDDDDDDDDDHHHHHHHHHDHDDNDDDDDDNDDVGPLSGQGATGGARTCDRRVPANFRADLISTVPPTPPHRFEPTKRSRLDHIVLNIQLNHWQNTKISLKKLKDG
ncbi:hypothetical protein PoB_002197500 [Plakobranchus ocellatus]|uniref:Uncharacterized protein n=1 Tax=Plakobranchus ocellatus TaxID=259542 RepID=A0AAV3ZLM0_9GAST|nr:hypothetical protein PoB_002197500 [Plakobranchus ocellatus]